MSSGLTNSYVLSLAVSGTNLFAGTGGGVFVSTNSGTSWTQASSGLINTEIYSLTISGTNLFAGTYSSGVYRRPFSEMIASAEMHSNETTSHFSLEQNYPNPFNPSTTISFSLPSKSYVSLKVFDVLGREVAVFLSEELPPGVHSRQWNAQGFPSGVYFYRLQARHADGGQAGTYVETKKLLLLR